jgi:hypothetical protein
MAKVNQQRQTPQAAIKTKQVSFFTLAGDRTKLVGACDGTDTLLSQTNGAIHTLKWPKNAGTCSLSIYSLDERKKPIEKSVLALGPNEMVESYSSLAGAQAIYFSCPVSVGEDRTCILEIDR